MLELGVYYDVYHEEMIDSRPYDLRDRVCSLVVWCLITAEVLGHYHAIPAPKYSRMKINESNGTNFYYTPINYFIGNYSL